MSHQARSHGPFSEVGGFFSFYDLLGLWAQQEGPAIAHALTSSFRSIEWTASGRGAVRLALEDARSKGLESVLLPSYLCPSIVHAARMSEVRVFFYPIRGSDLSVDAEQVLPLLGPSMGLYAIDYFGHPCDWLEEVLKRRCCYVFIDMSHSLSSERLGRIRYRVDYVIGSLRKLYPLPDGGFVASQDPLRVHVTDGHDAALMMAAMVLKSAYQQGQGVPKKLFLQLWQSYEDALDRAPMPARPSPLTAAMVDLLGIDSGLSQRRANYSVLHEGVGGTPDLIPMLPPPQDGMVPFGFPLITTRRDSLREWLVSKGVYPPVHWKLPQEVEDPVADSASRCQLTLPCDWRYTTADMRLILELLRSRGADDDDNHLGC